MRAREMATSEDRDSAFELQKLAPLAVLVLACSSLLVPVFGPGIWDPPELEVLEQARRIAIHVLGAEELALEQAVNEVPTRRELGRGELPFTSVALGLKLFGLADWAGRLPLALWAVLGVVATYVLVSRLADRGAAATSALVLCVTPLYFVQARSALGDVVTMAAQALACAGLAVALLDERASARLRSVALVIGAAGLYAGLWCRGLLLGVGVPLVSIAVARIAGRSTQTRLPARTRAIDLALVAGTVVSIAFGLRSLEAAKQGADYSVWVGASSNYAESPPTHDAVIHHLGHALFPISALLPFAFALLLRRDESDAGARRLRLLVVSAVVSAIVAHSLMTPLAGVLPFSATFACAIAVGLMLHDMRVRGAYSRALAMGVVATVIVLMFDFRQRPETAFAAYAVGVAPFPETLTTWHHRMWQGGAMLFALVFFLSYFEPADARTPKATWRVDFTGYWRALRKAYGGALWKGLCLLGGLALFWRLLLGVNDHVLQLDPVERMWSVSKALALHVWWFLPCVVLGVPLAFCLSRDAVRWASRGCGLSSRGGISTLALAAAGLLLSAMYYPALASQLSPKPVFASYAELHESGQPLGLLGVTTSVAAYYTHEELHWFDSAQAASRWLTQGDGRRFLVARGSDLPELNARYRMLTRPRVNLPVIDARSSEIVLASNRLQGARDHNPFSEWLLAARPSIAHPMDANLGGRLQVIGWELRQADGSLATLVHPGEPYQLRLAYEVTGRLTEDWETFVHIDGHGRRFNGDHPTLQGKYPLPLLNRGDVIVDTHRIVIDPNFTPGYYKLYFGLFRGSRRLPVERGTHDADRLDAGVVEIR